MADIGKRLRELRKNQGLTQEQVAEKLGVARTNIIKHEQNKMIPRPYHLEAYSKIYNTTISDILGESQEENVTIGEYFDRYFIHESKNMTEEEKKAVAQKLVDIYKLTQK